MPSIIQLVQLMDSAFPTGAFAHSFGLETAFQERRIETADDLAAWLKSYLRNQAALEGTAVYLAHAHARELTGKSTVEPEPGIAHLHVRERELTGKSTAPEVSRQDEMNARKVTGSDSTCAEAEGRERAAAALCRLDQRLHAAVLAREAREGNRKIGRRYLSMARELYPEAELDLYGDWIAAGRCHGSPAIVHGWVCAHLGYAAQPTLMSYFYSVLNVLLQNSLRAMPLGQTQGQLVLQKLLPHIERCAQDVAASSPTEDHLSGHFVLQEIAAMRHAALYSRLFMS